jgi:integrase
MISSAVLRPDEGLGIVVPRLFQRRVPLKVVSEQLGHASIAITADIYSDVYPELRADAARRINDLLGAARSVA